MALQKKFLQDILVIDLLENEEDDRASRTLENFKAYNLKHMVYNFAHAANQVKKSTLVNAWNNILGKADEEDLNTDGLESEDFIQVLRQENEEITPGEIENWLEVDADQQGYECLTENEIIREVLDCASSSDDSSSDEEIEYKEEKIKLSEALSHVDNLLKFIDQNDNENISAYRDKFREFRVLLTNDLKLKQLKISDFFK